MKTRSEHSFEDCSSPLLSKDMRTFETEKCFLKWTSDTSQIEEWTRNTLKLGSELQMSMNFMMLIWKQRPFHQVWKQHCTESLPYLAVKIVTGYWADSNSVTVREEKHWTRLIGNKKIRWWESQGGGADTRATSGDSNDKCRNESNGITDKGEQFALGVKWV